MIVFVHQPEYMPWLGFFDKLSRCDTYVIYDDAQYQHGGFHNRNRIRTLHGWEWLTVPITHGHPQVIKDVKIANHQWRNRQIDKITLCYDRTPYFKEYLPILKEAINYNHELLIDLNLHIIKAITKLLGIEVQMLRSSEFPHDGKEKNEKLVSMCKFLGADTYLCGSGGKAYVNEALFAEAKIKVQYHKYEHPTYRQRFEDFQPYMSIIDLLFNEGSHAKEILLKGGSIETRRLDLRPLIVEHQNVLAQAA
ncbi:MAG: WbqC family protein [Candidatus Bathyarchaeota archaeon]|nr:WbqC family protein [Candidatus Bathyarchaeota archaeon]